MEDREGSQLVLAVDEGLGPVFAEDANQQFALRLLGRLPALLVFTLSIRAALAVDSVAHRLW